MKLHQMFMLCAMCTAASSCEVDVYPCTESGVGLQFEGFADRELDTVVVAHFAEASDFSNPVRIDTLVGGPVYVQAAGDTERFIVGERWSLAAGNDYTVSVPRTGTRVTISRIRLEGQETIEVRHSIWSKKHVACINAVQTFEQDGRVVAPSNPETRGAIATIVR